MGKLSRIGEDQVGLEKFPRPWLSSGLILLKKKKDSSVDIINYASDEASLYSEVQDTRFSRLYSMFDPTEMIKNEKEIDIKSYTLR